MKESYREDLASSSGLEPYAGDGDIVGVAPARATWVIIIDSAPGAAAWTRRLNLPVRNHLLQQKPLILILFIRYGLEVLARHTHRVEEVLYLFPLGQAEFVDGVVTLADRSPVARLVLSITPLVACPSLIPTTNGP